MNMNTKKRVLAMAVTAAIGGAALPAYSQVTGVPGEALLVPLVLHDGDLVANEGDHTYVQINVPATLGTDLVLNTYTAPHVSRAGTVVAQSSPDFRIHWELFDPLSNPVQSGECKVSAGDTVLWTTDPMVYPATRCGPTNGLPVGATGFYYLVVQTVNGARGRVADFAMEATAFIQEDSINPVAEFEKLLSVPVFPMVDGRDSGNPLEQPQLTQNEVIQNNPNWTSIRSPRQVAPLATGIRMNNGDGFGDVVDVSGAVQGPGGAPWLDQGVSLHVLWFDSNNRGRAAYTYVWDDDETYCNMDVPLPRELNILAYNLSVSALPNGWEKIEAGSRENLSLTDVIAAVTVPGYQSGASLPPGQGSYCQPPGWATTVRGYAEYFIDEAPDTFARLTSAGVAFEAQEATSTNRLYDDAWATSMMSARGFQ
jgi:hypothetical protein